MRNLFLLLFFFAVFASASGQSPDNVVIKNTSPTSKKESTEIVYYYKLISVPTNKWCYDIYKSNKIFIHQTTIPGQPGTDGFKSKSDAKKVALLVIEKLNNGNMPPTVTKNEMEILGVL